MPNQKEIYQQSRNAYDQWCEQWREQAKKHSKFKMKSLDDFKNIGIGKACLCVANGYTFELEIETIKKYRDNVDILACDKTLGQLIEHGIYPDYLLLCDANVSFEKYCKPWIDKLDKTILFANVCANPEWTHNGNWKDIYFFVNKDILQSEKEFTELSGCNNVIAAATNVSNAQVVFLTQSDEKGSANFFGYDKILLIGFDYSWLPEKYYAFCTDGDGKNNYMRHVWLINRNNNLCYTSNNLQFSGRWLDKYVKTYNLPVVQCSHETIVGLYGIKNLSTQMQYRYKPEQSDAVRKMDCEMQELRKKTDYIKTQLRHIGLEHRLSYLATS